MDALTPISAGGPGSRVLAHDDRSQNDSPVREAGRAEARVVVAKGEAGSIELIENDARFVADLSEGQRPAGSTTSATIAASWRAWRRMRASSTPIATAAASACWRRRAARVRALPRPFAARPQCRPAGGGAERRRQDRLLREERGVRGAREAEAAQPRGRDLRSAGLREEPQGSQDRRAGLSQADAFWRRRWSPGAASSSWRRARISSIRRCSPSRSAAVCATPSAPGASC